MARGLFRVGVAVSLLASATFGSGRAEAAAICGCSDFAAVEAGCPSGTGSCVISGHHTLTSGCTVDCGSRAMSVTSSGELDAGTGTVTVKAGSLTVQAGGLIKANATTTAGTLTLDIAGDVLVDKSGSSVGVIRNIGTYVGGTIVIDADGKVDIRGDFTANHSGSDADGGTLRVTAGGNITSYSGSNVDASGGAGFARGGDVSLTSTGGSVTVAESVDVTGGELDSGGLTVNAATTASVNGVEGNASSDGGGGSLDVTAHTGATLAGNVRLEGSAAGGYCGDGGGVDVSVDFGNITVTGDITVDSGTDCSGGSISLTARGYVDVQATSFTARGEGPDSGGGAIAFSAGTTVSNDALLDTSGGDYGAGDVDITAGTGVTLDGNIDATGRYKLASGGAVTVLAGDAGTGHLTINGTIDASGGACDSTDTAWAGSIDAEGCNVTLASTGKLYAKADDGTITVAARENMNIAGTLNATKRCASGSDGVNTLVYRSGRLTMTGSATPTAVSSVQGVCTAPGQTGCLDPCPTCGDGVVSYPETCDGGNSMSCDGCSAVCQLENCACATSCSTTLGCGGTAPDGTACSDGQVCNGAETCQTGSCTAGSNAASGTSCSDGNACTVSDACDGSGSCQAGGALDCADSNQCTNDLCNSATGCYHTNVSNGTACNDGQYCTVNDTCQSGSCSSGGARNCDDGQICTTDSCNESTDMCVHTSIIHLPPLCP